MIKIRKSLANSIDSWQSDLYFEFTPRM